MTEQTQPNSLLGKIAAYTEILAKDPQSTIFVSLGEAYRKMGMLDDARQVIEKGLEASPDFSPAYIVLGRVLCQQGDYQSSESAFLKALEHDPESLAALVGYARLSILTGHESKAREVLLTARELSPADPIINKLLLSLPKPEPRREATEPIDQVEEQEPSAEITAAASAVESEISAEPERKDAPPLASPTLAELYLKQGLTEQALEVYRQLSKEEPENLLFRRKIRDLEEGSPEGEEAVVEENPAATEAVVPTAETVEPVDDLPSSDAAMVVENQAGAEVCDEVSSAADEGLPSADEKAVLTLNRWLESIQKRREDV